MISLDWQGDLATIKSTLPDSMAVQGNLDPFLLYASESLLEERVLGLLESMRGTPGFIMNLGHGILPDMDPERIGQVVSLVQNFSH